MFANFVYNKSYFCVICVLIQKLYIPKDFIFMFFIAEKIGFVVIIFFME